MFQYFNQLNSEPVRTQAIVNAYGDVYNSINIGVQPTNQGAAVFVSNGPLGIGGLIKIEIPANSITTGNFTFEFWAYPNYQGTTFLRKWITWGTINNSQNLDFRTENSLLPTNLNTYRNNTALTSDGPIQSQIWHHVAYVRNSGASKVYINGVNNFPAFVDTFNYSNYNLISLGGYATATSGIRLFHGFMDEFRLSNTARYTTNFTPPTAKFTNDANTIALIHCENPVFTNSQVFEDDAY
jgi:hypothetical protein